MRTFILHRTSGEKLEPKPDTKIRTAKPTFEFAADTEIEAVRKARDAGIMGDLAWERA